MSINKQYTQEIKKETTYSATWLPNLIVHPGDIGTLTNYNYHHVTNLSNFGINFNVVQDSTEMEFNYTSSDSVTIDTKLSGHVAPSGSNLSLLDQGVLIRFSKDKAIIFRLAKCKSTMIDNMKPIEDTMISLQKSREWKDDWVLVTEVLRAQSGTIIISNSKDAGIDLLAKGRVNLATFDLADVGAHFKVVKRTNIATEIVAAKGLTPLFRTCRVKLSILQNASMAYDNWVSPFGNLDFKLCVEFADYSDFDDLAGSVSSQ
jgi:hypothetical protein